MLTFADLKSLIKIKWEESQHICYLQYAKLKSQYICHDFANDIKSGNKANCQFQPFILPSSLKNVNESLCLPFFAYSRFNKNI